jgi:hypothetical protein
MNASDFIFMYSLSNSKLLKPLTSAYHILCLLFETVSLVLPSIQEQ